MPNLQRCSYCETRPDDKLSQVTWAWLLSNRQRTAYRQKLCPMCVATNLLAVDKGIAAGERLTCPSCGIDTEDDMDPVYATAYFPGYGKERYEMPFCGACAVEIRSRAQKNAEHLEDREMGSRGQAPGNAPSPATVWEALGLRPRNRGGDAA